MTALPLGWCNARFADVADIQLGKMLDRAKNQGVPTPYLRNVNVRWGRVDISDILTMPMSEEERRKFSIEDGDVLVCEGGEPGRAAVWRSGPTDLKFQKALLRLRSSTATCADWLASYLRLASQDGTLDSSFSGTTIKHLPREALQALALPLPPLAEQRRIVAKIASLSAKSKRARDHLDHVPRLVAAYRQAVLVAAFTGRLTADWRRNVECLQSAAELIAATDEPGRSRGGRDATDAIKPGQAALSVNKPDLQAPENWSWVRLARIARQETGHTPSRSKPEYWDGGVPWIGIRDAGAHHGRLIHHTDQTISQLGLQNSSARLLPAGTVCLSRTASVGYVTIMGVSMATSQDFATWSCTDALEPEYLMYALMAEGERIRDFGEGSTHTTIYFPEIRALHICLAPKIEQVEIVRRVKAAFSWIDRLSTESANACKLIERLDQAILSKAFRGELVLQDPNDEPASVLLERIRAEGVGSGPARRGRGRPRLTTAI